MAKAVDRTSDPLVRDEPGCVSARFLSMALMAASRRRFDWLSWLLFAVMVGASVVAWNRVPAELPVHWDWQGEPDRVTSRDFALTMLPLAGAGTLGLFWLLARGLPVRENVRVSAVLRIASQGLLGLLALMHLALILGSLGGHVSVPRVAIGGAALLVMLLGVVMRSVPPNRLVGIRIPATLADREIWRRTHRLTATLFALVGLLTLAASLLPLAAQTAVLLIGLLAAIAAAVGFATRLRRRSDPSDPPVSLPEALRREDEGTDDRSHHSLLAGD